MILEFNVEKGVTIGFEEETVQVDRNIGMKTLCVNVSRGQLGRTTTVNVSSQDQTAISEYTTKINSLAKLSLLHKYLFL